MRCVLRVRLDLTKCACAHRPKHTAKPAATADKEKAAAPSSLQRDVAALLEQLSEEEEE